ncbi:TonB-dependent receptor plug domain-containing protein [Qipengyuania sp. GH1]|uniref:TonB-dependent receptor plug domain-containing protein n=1 Tax=Qipengyuania aestuarii TaxID=2867241 RepID=UPI001C8691EF|nr:TonB-dependent receptor plug domain-containing protein [Qipengyuania aestuarii]MBX7535505.1 TonB-dependent receptor plug domain-containing protein [Qipengyuania aestuarii]
MTPLAAQDAVDASVIDQTPAGSSQMTRTFEPAFFAEYAPRNALDMVSRIPGFSISGGNDGQRGLGQADQNVLVNGKRFSSKSDSLSDQLRRIPAADVVRIELVDGNTLDIPGLTGLVANVVYVRRGASGQFRWDLGFRPYNADPRWYGGEASLTGSSGALDFTVSLSNENNRFGADGDTLVYAPDSSLTEEQYSRFSGAFDNPKLATNFTYTLGPASIANLNLSYGEDFYNRDEFETGIPVSGPIRQRSSLVREDGPEYEIGGDVEFPLGPGSLKLIGLERFERDNYENTLVDSFSDDRPAIGSRFRQTNETGERIGRLEYQWNMLASDWQVAGEAAFNRLDRRSSLFRLGETGEFFELDFPAGTGGVAEDRYDTSLSWSKPISSALSVQLIGGMEFSTIEQTGAAANARSFKRPKGSLAATWKPQDNFDVSLTLARRVSQLSFGDFLASVSLGNDNQNGGNNQLVPYQSWNVELQANRNFGEWLSLQFDVRQAWFEDFIDWFPLPDGGEARGNIGDAQRLHLGLDATVRMDTFGWNGARFDVRLRSRDMDVTDPFTGESRAFSGDTVDLIDVDFRHDIQQSNWAWGASLFSEGKVPYSRRYEFGREWEGPTFVTLFAEHKDVMGLTVQGRVRNLLGARDRFERTVYDTPRPDGLLAFSESRDRRIGPTFELSISGSL